MLLAVWIAIALTASTFVILLVIIVVHRAWSGARSRRLARRRAELEPKLLQFIHSEERSVLAMLGGALPKHDREAMEGVLLDYAQRVRGIELERIQRAAEELGYVDRYLDRLEHGRWWARAEAAEKLGTVGAERALPALVAALEDEVPEVRLRAAGALGRLGGRASVAPLVDAMDRPDRWSSIRIGDILAEMGHDVQLELLERFGGLTPAGKVAALDILARLRPINISDWLVERLDEADPDVRARACHALGAIGDRHASTTLRVALSDEAWPVRAMAAKALGRLASEEAIPELCATMRDREWWPRSNAAAALRAIGPRGLEALESMLVDEDAYARHQAVLMLEAAGEVDQAAEALDDGRDETRRQAIAFLRKVMDAGQTARLHELAREHARPGVRIELEQLLSGAMGTA